MKRLVKNYSKIISKQWNQERNLNQKRKKKPERKRNNINFQEFVFKDDQSLIVEGYKSKNYIWII